MSLFPKLGSRSYKIVIFTLFLFGFFGLNVFQISGYHYVTSFILLLIAYMYKDEVFLYKKYIFLYVCGFIISCVYSSLMNGQPFLLTMSFCNLYIGLTFSLYLVHKGIPSKELEKIFIFVAVLFVLLYIIQWMVFPYTLVSSADVLAASDTEEYRLRIPGSLCAFGLFFFGVNQILLKHKKQGLLYACLGALPIIIMGFRTLTLLVVLCSFLMIATVTRKFKKTLWYGILFSLLFIGATNIPIVDDKIQEMTSRQENEEDAGTENNIRLIAFEYLTDVQFTKPGEKVFGGGIPVMNTRYSQELNSLVTNLHIYWVDIGLIGLSYVLGIPTVLMLCFIYLLCAWRCGQQNLQYIRFTAITMVFGSAMTTMELYRAGNILLFSLLLCIEYKCNCELKEYRK